MRVMFVCTTGGSGRRQIGGAERFLAEMLPAIAAEGVDVVACTPDDEVAAALRGAGVRWIELAARRRVDPQYVRGIRRAVRAVRPDVVSAHLLSAAMHARAALGVERRRTPLVVALHNSLWQYRDTAGSGRERVAVQANIAVDLLLRRLRPHASVAVSAFEARELRERGGVRGVEVIDNPLPAAWPAPSTPRGPAARGAAVRVGFLGRLEREKGADLLGSVAAELPEAEFLIAGAGSVPVPDRPNVKPVGRVDAASFLSEVDCLLVPSRVESFGRSALEAMSLGVPVVHSGAGGLTDLTRRADGVLAYPSDLLPAALAAAVRAATAGPLPTDPTLAGPRLELARWYAEEFSFARCVSRWVALYRSVGHERR